MEKQWNAERIAKVEAAEKALEELKDNAKLKAADAATVRQMDKFISSMAEDVKSIEEESDLMEIFATAKVLQMA